MRRAAGCRKRKGQKPKISTLKQEKQNSERKEKKTVENPSLDEEENGNQNDDHGRNGVLNPNPNPNEDLKYNFWALWLCGWLTIAPASFDLSTGKGTAGLNSLWRKIIFWLWLIFIIIRHSLMIIMTVVQAFSIDYEDENEDERAKVYDFSLMVTASVVFSLLLYLYFVNFVFGDMATLLVSYNSILTPEPELERFRNADVKKRKTFRELLLIFLPFSIYAVVLCITGLMLVRPHNPALLSSFVVDQIQPSFDLTFFTQWRPLLLYLLFGLIDHVYVFFNITVIYYGVIQMFLFIERMKQKTLHVSELLRGEHDGLGIFERIDIAVRLIQTIKLQLMVFNQFLSGVVFFTKLIALTAAIVGGFGAVKLFDRSPMFAAIFFVLFVEANAIYFILFDSAYQIGENLEALKGELLTRTGLHPKIGQRHEKKQELNRRMRSVQDLGIKSGGFNNMERESTLLFSDFSVGQIVDLLMTF